jgi:hypothetical protein
MLARYVALAAQPYEQGVSLFHRMSSGESAWSVRRDHVL